MSNTPRTNAEISRVERAHDSSDSIRCRLSLGMAMRDLARQLERELAEARAENNVLKAALWYYGNRMGPNIAEELKDGLPERLWRKINLKEVEETDGWQKGANHETNQRAEPGR